MYKFLFLLVHLEQNIKKKRRWDSAVTITVMHGLLALQCLH